MGQYARAVSIWEKSDIHISNNKQFWDTYWYIGEEYRIRKRDHTTGENEDGGSEGGALSGWIKWKRGKREGEREGGRKSKKRVRGKKLIIEKQTERGGEARGGEGRGDGGRVRGREGDG